MPTMIQIIILRPTKSPTDLPLFNKSVCLQLSPSRSFLLQAPRSRTLHFALQPAGCGSWSSCGSRSYGTSAGCLTSLLSSANLAYKVLVRFQLHLQQSHAHHVEPLVASIALYPVHFGAYGEKTTKIPIRIQDLLTSPINVFALPVGWRHFLAVHISSSSSS